MLFRSRTCNISISVSTRRMPVAGQRWPPSALPIELHPRMSPSRMGNGSGSCRLSDCHARHGVLGVSGPFRFPRLSGASRHMPSVLGDHVSNEIETHPVSACRPRYAAFNALIVIVSGRSVGGIRTPGIRHEGRRSSAELPHPSLLKGWHRLPEPDAGYTPLPSCP